MSRQFQVGVQVTATTVCCLLCWVPLQAFADEFNKRLKGRSWRITNMSDIVPRWVGCPDSVKGVEVPCDRALDDRPGWQLCARLPGPWRPCLWPHVLYRTSIGTTVTSYAWLGPCSDSKMHDAQDTGSTARQQGEGWQLHLLLSALDLCLAPQCCQLLLQLGLQLAHLSLEILLGPEGSRRNKPQ